MFKQVNRENEAFQKYLNMLAFRFTLGSMELEEEPYENVIDSNHAVKLSDNLDAFQTLFFEREDHTLPLTEREIKNTVNVITSGCVDANYRRRNVMIAGADNPLCDAPRIHECMLILMHNYSFMTADWDPFSREAYFHIEFVHIHPFDDGNGRTARLIMAYNLCRQNIAPAIITNSDKTLYNKMIREKDVDGLANFLRTLSKNEENVMSQVLGDDFHLGEECIQKSR